MCVARDVMMSLPRRKMPAWVTVALLWCVAPLTMAAVAPLDIEVTIPPLLETQPSRSEVLFTVNHDPDQPPEPFTLPCRADALPAPSYSWLKNGENFDLDDDEEDKERVTMVEGEGSLVFHDPRPEDEGNYQCVAENSVGVAYSEVTPVRRAVMGNFPKAEPRVVTATLGQSLSLPCTPPEGYPEPSLHWVLQTSDGGLRSLNSPRLTVDEKGTLWFSYVVPEDASEDALYACAASSTQMYLVKDEEGRLEMVEEEPSEEVFTTINLQTEYRMGNWVYLNVSYPGDDKTTLPEDSQPPVQQYVSESQVTALEGDDIKLYCIYGGYPVPEVRWWRESRGDVESDKLDHYGKVLVLEDLEEVDMGSYYCQATNEAGESDTQHFTVYVEAAPEFVVEPGVINSPQGATAVFNCEASGDPKPTITWTKNGQLLDTHETTVVFDTLESSMKAAIACNASNEHGYVYKSVYLNVLSLPPEWLTEPADLAVLEGGAATLECEAYGSPDPNMTWAKMEGDEKVIIDDGDPRYDVEDNKLIIKSVDEDTEGQYICIATNKFASLNSVAEIVMREKTGAEASLSSDRVEANDHVSLNCLVKIDSHLKPEVTWFKDDVKINLKDDNYRLGRSEFPDNKIDDGDEDDDEDGREEETWVLEIMKVHGHDSGVYTCSVHTEVDDASDNVILTVEDVPNSPHLMTAHCEDREAFLEWSSTGDNNAPLQGFVIQYVTPFHPDDWKDAENKIPASSTSFSVDMSPGLNYTFRVLAFNRVGMSDPSEDTAQCFPPGLPPDHHPYNVTVTGTSPGTLVISWQNVTTTDEVEGETKTEDEENDDDGWHTMIFDDWEKNQVEMTELPPYLEYEVEVEAHNAYGAAPPSLLTYTGHSGQDEPEDEPDDLKVLDADATDAVLTWTPVDQDSLNGLLLGYKIEYWEDHDGDDDDDELHEEVLATGSVGRAELKGLTPFMSYRARVSAVNSAFTGPASTIVAFKTAEGESGPVSNMESKQLGDDSLLLSWEAPEEPHGVVRGYKVHYCTINGDGEEGPVTNYSETLTPNLNIVKLTDLESGATYRVTVAAINGAGDGEGLSLDHDMEVLDPRVPAVPVFTWLVLEEEDEEQPGTDRDGDGDVDDNDVRNKNIIIGDTDGDGDVDEDDVLDTDNDGDIDEDDINVADINNDGTVDVEDVKAADRDNDGFVDIGDIGDEDGDGDFDGADVLAADEDGDGDIDSSDDDEEDVLLEDRDQDGDIDKDDVVDINHDGILDEKDFRAADVDNDGDVDEDDVKVADKDGDGDIDGADLTDLDKDGRVDGDDLEVVDIDGDDRDGDGDFDREDVTDLDGDGDIDSEDIAAADVDDDGDVDMDDLNIADKDGDGDVDEADMADLDGDGKLDGDDLEINDHVLDTDGDGDIDDKDFDVADINNDGNVDMKDVAAADRDHDGDVDEADIGDEDNDGDIDGNDVIAADEDGDGDIDAADDDGESILLSDTDGDGDVDLNDVIDLDGDGDIDEDDNKAADIDNDGDVDVDDVKAADRDKDGDVDAADIVDINDDGHIDGRDLVGLDRDNDGDIDSTDIENLDVFLKDTDGDGDVDEDDVLDVDHDGDIDEDDIAVADINNDGNIDSDDVVAGDRDGDNDVDFKDIGDEDGDGDIDGSDVVIADRDGDGDIDAADEGRGVEVRVNWTPDLEAHPGVDFYVQNSKFGFDFHLENLICVKRFPGDGRVKGTQHWKSSPVERQHLYQTISGLDPRRSYEVRIVAKDGPYETPSDIKYLAATEGQCIHVHSGKVTLPLCLNKYDLAT
ncbi:Neuroglian-like 1 [Homarus americanus]|uniref:Neuroglian-like 1 n=1 Tax=Homarus americanus TaxID=6706 RepID=A0A8J5MMZ3_HOMAM|nr:Neuroglian-like 1 [Homarus americanus]